MKIDIGFLQGFLLSWAMFSWGILISTHFANDYKGWVVAAILATMLTIGLAVARSDE